MKKREYVLIKDLLEYIKTVTTVDYLGERWCAFDNYAPLCKYTDEDVIARAEAYLLEMKNRQENQESPE